MRALIILICLCFFASGCQTSRAVSFAYHDATYGGDHYQRSDRTSVLFLLDGFSADMLRTSLESENVPAIKDAFTLSSRGRFSLGRAVFPSLTFPNISSILTGEPISHHPIIGNRAVIDGGVVNFESVTNWNQLGLLLQRRTIFYRLATKNETSVSYAYAFSGGATAYQMTSAAAAASYLENDYASVDTDTILSLKNLLLSTSPDEWPRFVFVHIIGIDATAHRFGPQDDRVQAYVHWIDDQLTEVFHILNHPNGTAASTRHVNYALTADHGFRSTPDHSPLEDVVAAMNTKGHKLRLIADNRVAPLYIDEQLSEDQKLKMAQALLQVPHVGWAAVKTPHGVELFRHSGEHARMTIAEARCADGQLAARFEWYPLPATENQFSCLSDFDSATGPQDDSFIVPALVDYFESPQAPAMVFIPDDHSDFAEGYAGNHGGLTRDEMLVPVLTKDVDVERGVHPTSTLIRAMGAED